MKKQLDRLFRPQTIAVIGATNAENKVGFVVFKNILQSNWVGDAYPINLKYKTVQGKQCYSYLRDVPKPVDLVLITTPAHTVTALVKECGKAQVGGVVILSSDFQQLGDRRFTIYQNISQAARQYNIRVIGPNSLGFINPWLQLNASYASVMALPGKIAFISQSTALTNSVLDWSVDQNVGFSYVVTISSMTDVSFGDLIDYFGTDSTTSCILLYMQSLTQARRFMSAARAFSRSKPIIVLKAGKSQDGARASFTHTGILAGNDAVFDAAFRRAGLIRVDTIAKLFNCAQALAMQRRPAGNQLAIVTNAGGAGVLATDYLIEGGGQLATFSEQTKERLKTTLKSVWTISNPLDLESDASAEDFFQATQICLQDVNVDGLLVILTPQHHTQPAEVAKKIVAAAKKSNKTVLAAWMGEQGVAEGRAILEQGQVPVYRFPESAVDVFLKMNEYARNLKLLQETTPDIPEKFHPKTEEVNALIQQAFQKRRLRLNESEAKQLLAYYDIPVAPHRVATTAEEAATAAAELGFPVAVKILSSDVNHKTEIGGIQLHIQHPADVKIAFHQIQSNFEQAYPLSVFEGVLVEKMMPKRYELLIGAKKDSIFGAAIVFGKGGGTAEVYQDVSIALPPLNMTLARRLLERTKSFQILQGYRGYPAVDVEQLQFLLYKFAYLIMDFPQIQEIDINPFALDETGGVVLDAHITLDPRASKSRSLEYPHLVISPYPSEYVKTIQLKGGLQATLRPIRPEDEQLEKEFFHYLSEKTIYFRFFGHLSHFSPEMLARFTQIDYDRELAIVAEAEVNDKKRLLGVVRLIADAWNEKAEYAIVVADDFQGQGIGNLLTDYIFDIARQRGIRTIYASVLANNDRMLHLFERRGFTKRKEDFETYYVEKEL